MKYTISFSSCKHMKCLVYLPHLVYNPPGVLYQGIQLYADAIDRDGGSRNDDDLIESFSIDLEPGRLAPGLKGMIHHDR